MVGQLVVDRLVLGQSRDGALSAALHSPTSDLARIGGEQLVLDGGRQDRTQQPAQLGDRDRAQTGGRQFGVPPTDIARLQPCHPGVTQCRDNMATELALIQLPGARPKTPMLDSPCGVALQPLTLPLDSHGLDVDETRLDPCQRATGVALRCEREWRGHPLAGEGNLSKLARSDPSRATTASRRTARNDGPWVAMSGTRSMRVSPLSMP